MSLYPLFESPYIEYSSHCSAPSARNSTLICQPQHVPPHRSAFLNCWSCACAVCGVRCVRVRVIMKTMKLVPQSHCGAIGTRPAPWPLRPLPRMWVPLPPDKGGTRMSDHTTSRYTRSLAGQMTFNLIILIKSLNQ
jgi:hypothetical protein